MGLADPLTALNDSIRANPKEWYKALELDPANDRFEHGQDIYVVVVQAVTKGEGMRVVVDGNLKGDTTLKSEILSGIFGK